MKYHNRMENKMKRIGIIGAMEEEVAILKEQMAEQSAVKNRHYPQSTNFPIREQRVLKKANMTFVQGELWGTDTVLVVSGIGKVNMAICTQILIDLFDVDVVINTGVAGSLNAALDIGDIILSTCAQQHDMDVSPLGDPVGVIPRMDVSIFRADETLIKLAKAACEKANPDIRCYTGKVVSGDQFIADAAKKDYLVQTFHGDCAEMEGAAMAQTAYLNHIPFLIIRAISDKADNSGHMDYPVFAKQAITHTVRLLEEMYKQL